MIDTIRLRINSIDKYPVLYEQLYTAQRKKGSVTSAYVDKDTGEMLERTLLASYIFHDTNRVLPVMCRSSLHIASSDYSVSFKVDTTKNYIQFDLSIPKYVYSTNVIQFINIHDQGCHVVYLELMAFIHKFLKEELIHTPRLEDVEIFQIDLCYNQFFNSRSDAFQYLDEQKLLLKKYGRSSSNKVRDWSSSFMYTTARYSFKVYHKGEEFKKNDYKKLVQKNPKNLPLQYLCDQADNILRYEMSFRRPMLNYLVHHHFNASKESVDNPLYVNHPYAKYCRKLAVWDCKRFQQYISRYRSFCIQSGFDGKHAVDMVFNDSCVTFDETVFSILYKTFWDKVVQYQLTKTCSIAGVVERIRKYNENNELKNQLRRRKTGGLASYRLISAALLVMKGFKLNEFKELMPRSSLFRLKADLKKIGVDDNDTSMQMPIPKTDYLDYKIFFKQFH